jgi:trehalose 6-phosphate synthase
MGVWSRRRGEQARRIRAEFLTTPQRRLIVLANRAPVSHVLASDGRIRATHTASGLVTALDPLLSTHSGTWVAHGAGNADRLVTGFDGGIQVPDKNPRYRLRYVWLTAEEHRRYYGGFANEGLWPLCHDLEVTPVFRDRDFDAYRAVNSKFVTAVVQESGSRSPTVLVQDYHFALAPRLLRRQLPASRIVTFWHIPWPKPDVLAACPWAVHLLEGLLGSSVLGFQTAEDCLNFTACVERWLDAAVDWNHDVITYRGHATSVRAYPVGIEWNSEVVRTTPPVSACRQHVRDELRLPADVQLGVGVDRLDYTKGIPQKFLAVERCLEQHPELRGKFQFVQIAEPSRGSLPAYQEARRSVVDTCDRVNRRFRDFGIEPIRLLEVHHESDAVYRFYRAADVCYVGSLRDGMNLVAKEFVNARHDERGVLILSELTGAARQLQDALLVNPHDSAAAADALHTALCMPATEQAARMQSLRAVVRSTCARWWAEQLLQEPRTSANTSADYGRAAEQLPA